jgi:hypothetical protein
MKKKTDNRFEITELFMAEADKYRRFFGVIKRNVDEAGQSFVHGKILVLDGYIMARAGDQDALGKKLDELCKMVLDMGLHKNSGFFIKLCEFECSLN